MGLIDPFKESIESTKVEVYSAFDKLKTRVIQSAEEKEASFKTTICDTWKAGKEAYLREKEDGKKLLRRFRPVWFDNFEVIRQKRIDLLRETGLANRITGFVFASAIIFAYSRGIRGKFRNTLLFGVVVGAVAIPEVVNPFNKV